MNDSVHLDQVTIEMIAKYIMLAKLHTLAKRKGFMVLDYMRCTLLILYRKLNCHSSNIQGMLLGMLC